MAMVSQQTRVAIVTGSAHGIGKAILSSLGSRGYKAYGLDRDTVDVGDPGAVNEFVRSIGVVDVLVNNAGGVCNQTHRPIEDVQDAAWEEIVRANLTGTFYLTRAVVPGMKQRRWGRIVNISSGAGRSVSLTGIQAYASSKAGQIGFTRQMAHELGQYGITVNCVAPGFTLSNPSTRAQWDSYGVDGQAQLINSIAVRRLGEPSDIAHAVCFFVAAESSWITGQTLSVDGGRAIFG